MADAAGRWKLAGGVLLAGVVVTAMVLGGRQAAALLPAFVERVKALGPLGPVIFVLAYAVAAVALVPASLLTLATGAAFGLVRGVPIALAGATLGASLAFLITRHLARSRVERAIAGHPKFAAIDRAIGQDGRRIVFLLRLSPLFPYNLMNYALGLTTVRFRDYVVASIGMLPPTTVYVYYGKVVGDLAALSSGAAPIKGPWYYALLGLGIVATIAATVLVTRTARRALTESVPDK